MLLSSDIGNALQASVECESFLGQLLVRLLDLSGKCCIDYLTIYHANTGLSVMYEIFAAVNSTDF